MPEDRPAQLKQDIVKALLLRPLGGELQDLGAAAEQLAGVASRGRRLHLVAGQHPHLHTRLVERLDGICSLFLQPGGKREYKGSKETETYEAAINRAVPF